MDALPYPRYRLRDIAMTRLKQYPAKLGIKTKRHNADWSATYLGKLLFQSPKRAKEISA